MRRIAAGLAAAALALTGIALPAVPANAIPSAPPIEPSTIGFANGFTAADMAAIAGTGANSIRIDLAWEVLQPTTEGVWDYAALSRLDALIDAAYNNGVKVLGIVDYAPSWATGKTGAIQAMHPYPMESKMARFGQFAADMATRYWGKISAFEIWNEPNIASFAGGNPDVTKYVTMFRTAYNWIKAVDGRIPVITGGTAMAPDALLDPSKGPASWNYWNISPLTFINGLYAAKAQGLIAFDAIAMHPYPVWTDGSLLSDFQNESWSARYQIEHVRTTMVNGGDAGKKIWFTEYGAPTVPTGGCTEPQQDDKILHGINFMRTLGYQGPIFIYSYRDLGTGNADREFNFGVLRSDNSRKPAWYSVVSTSKWRPWMGNATGPILGVPAADWSYMQTFQQASLTTSPAGTFLVLGSIRDKYMTGYSWLGAATTDELDTGDGVGKYNLFRNQNGSIYWSPSTGAHFVIGSIRDFWNSRGGPLGFLRYPTTDELVAPDGRTYQQFQGGRIYYTPATGPYLG
jgi:hypothetical protein